MNRKVWLVLMLAVLMVFAGCISGEKPEKKEQQELRLYAGAGMKKAMDVVIKKFEEEKDVIMFGGNLPGSTQVLASYVFSMVETGEIEMAVTASAFCIILSLVIVLILRWRKRDVGGLRPL